MNITWILCETCMKLNAHFIHKKTSSVSRKHKNEHNRQKIGEMPNSIMSKFWSIIDSSLAKGGLQVGCEGPDMAPTVSACLCRPCSGILALCRCMYTS